MSNPPPFDANDFSLQARSALNALQHAMQVVINAGVLLEQEMGHPLDPPAPRRFLYPRDPEKTAAVVKAEASPPPDASAQDSEDADEKAAKLRELHARPPSARFTTEETALYLNCNTSLLRTWRWQGRGPPFEGSGRMIRYTRANLDKFMAA